MELLLCEDVKRLGWRGDVVEVAAGYARNYLLPQGLAIEACAAPPALVKQLSVEKRKRIEEMERERRGLLEVVAAVDGAEVVIGRAANEQGRLFGSVTSSDIAANLAEQGFEVAPEGVQLAEHIKQVGTHQVRLKFAAPIRRRRTVAAGKSGGEARLPDGQDLPVAELAATINVIVVSSPSDSSDKPEGRSVRTPREDAVNEKGESEPVDQSR